MLIKAASGAAKCNVLVGVTGSVAAIKAEDLCGRLGEFANVRVVLTKSSLAFVTPHHLEGVAEQSFTDQDEWRNWKQKGDPVLHIDLRRWADVLVLAPLSANTLAKLASGLCDNLLTCIFRAWDFSKPALVCPAMNTLMWTSPFTQPHLDSLKGMGVHVVMPVVKQLACGDIGTGAMAPTVDIAEACRQALEGQLNCQLNEQPNNQLPPTGVLPAPNAAPARPSSSSAALKVLLDSFDSQSIDVSDANGKTALHCAVEMGDMDAVEALLASGAQNPTFDHNGRTPLHSAADKGDVPIALLLCKTTVEWRDPVNCEDRGGVTPLHLAAAAGHEDLARLLLLHGASVNAQDNKGETPLHYAAGAGHVDVMRALMEAGADRCAKDSNGSTPLHWAVSKRRRAAV